MASSREIAAVYAAAVVQGITLVTFPAVSAIFTSRAYYGLSTTEYGGMFVPQAITAVLSSLAGAGLTRLVGGKRVLLLGMAANLFSMVLLFASQFVADDAAFAFVLLLVATGCLGVGFGFAVPALNTFTAAFFPSKVDTAILTLNALLGVGTALAPIFAIVFVGLKIWWGLPVLMSALTLALLLFSWTLPLRDAPRLPETVAPGSKGTGFPPRFWLYAAFALVYGICETLSANWATVYLSAGLGASTALASMALTVFWGAVTGGRVLFAAIEKWFPPQVTYRLLPFVIAVAFLAAATTPRAHPFLAVVSFGLAGLGCSALLPLVISFGQGELTSMTAAVAGGIIGFYQMGYGIAAFGVGPLETLVKLSLASIYGGAVSVAVGLGALAFVIVIGHPRPSQATNLLNEPLRQPTIG
jgi:MFS family permease